MKTPPNSTSRAERVVRIGASDLSRYRDVPFGSTVGSVVAVTRSGTDAVKVLHERPSLIQELRWRPQYALGRLAGVVDPAQEITFRFIDEPSWSCTRLGSSMG